MYIIILNNKHKKAQDVNAYHLDEYEFYFVRYQQTIL